MKKKTNKMTLWNKADLSELAPLAQFVQLQDKV
jgi:hypothetical protein